PTALATLGILLMRRGTVPWLLGLIPLLWCIVSGLTYLAMEIDYGLLTPLAAVVALVAAALLRMK
ncbi:MAG: MFS transporter permease, partial [Candidatus Sedimenticola sp. 6PFRAG1]